MKPRPFDYIRPDSVAEAIEVLGNYGEDARVLAGGQSLMAMLNLRLVEPAVILDIGGLQDLKGIKIVDDVLEVGAAVTQNELLQWPQLRATVPLLAEAMPWVGHFQTRNRGTVCGSICHADPSSEIPLSLATLGGQVVLKSERGTRTVNAADFQVGMLSTAREPEELVVAARFPTGPNFTRVAFREVARRHGDFAILALAGVAQSDTSVRIGIGGLSDRPVSGSIDTSSPEAIRDALETLAWELEGTDDIHATARYRRDLLRRLGPKVIEQAIQCAA